VYLEEALIEKVEGNPAADSEELHAKEELQAKNVAAI
jgi:hypothetical protein